MTVKLAILVALALPICGMAQAGTQTQFDLVCAGTAHDPISDATTPWSNRYSVDLPAAAWCEIGCSSAQPIAKIEPGAVYLEDGISLTGDSARKRSISVSRATGSFVELDFLGAPLIRAHCVMDTFTPLPKNQF